jgi:ethanolamine-phosphate cytidylyltransferase
MFHCGHVAFLEEAKSRGDYLIVGIHGDAAVNRERGCNLPLMNLHERVLSVLGCRFVDDVLIDAPLQISPQMIQSLGIHEVLYGRRGDDFEVADKEDRYGYAKKAGIFTELNPPSNFTLSSIVDRIQANQAMFQAKIVKKKKAEADFYEEKYNQVQTE